MTSLRCQKNTRYASLCRMHRAGGNASGECLDIPEVITANLGNVSAMPDESTYHRLPWATDGRYRVSEFLYEPHWLAGGAQEGSPRVAARRQLEELARLGFTLRSAFECEFTVVDAPTKRPVFAGRDAYAAFVFSQHEHLLYELGSRLKESGISVEACQTEVSPGQFELALRPELGKRGADAAFSFKEAVKEFYHGKQYQATFMSKPFADGDTSALQFNHSLIDEAGKKVFSDASSKHNMSEIARYWLGGLIKHTRSFAALLAPTVNCYRRFRGEWVPKTANWGLDDRMCGYRVKIENSSDIYFRGEPLLGSRGHSRRRHRRNPQPDRLQ